MRHGWLPLTAVLVLAGAVASAAQDQPMKLKTEDGRTVILYGDKTWEFEWPMPGLKKDTVAANDLVSRPDRQSGKDLVVTGKLVRLLGTYHLQATDPQNSIVVDLSAIRRADQIAVDKGLKKAGLTGSLKVQIQGRVEKGTITHYVKAKDVLILP